MSDKLEIDEIFELPVFVSDGFVESENFRYLHVIDDFDWHEIEGVLGATVEAINNHKLLTEEKKRLYELLKGAVIEFDSDYLDGDAYGLMCGIKQLLSELDGDK